MKFDFKKLDYEFDLNGYVVLKKIIPENIIKKANENLQEAANEAAQKSPPKENISKFMGAFFGSIKKKMDPK